MLLQLKKTDKSVRSKQPQCKNILFNRIITAIPEEIIFVGALILREMPDDT